MLDVAKIRDAFERMRAATFSDRYHRGHVVMPIEAWLLFERTVDNALRCADA